MTDVSQTKRELRKAILAARIACGNGHSQQMIAYVERHGYKRVAAYENFGTEPSTEKFLSWASKNNVEVLLPEVVSETKLSWTSGTGASLQDCQVIFAPALAVGLDGTRLGRGKGYYDRALQSVDVPVIALVHDNELLDSVPSEGHDERIFGAITCSRTVELN